MADIGHMNFFKVNECGLYKVSDPQAHGLGLSETFDLIQTWIKDRPMSMTMPWDAPTKTKPRCYCREIHKDQQTGDYVVVLWKSESDSAGAIWGAEEDTANGTGEVYEYSNEVKGKKIIWGRPCYYWVIPSMNTVVSIKFEHSLCDSQMFQDYVTECIRNRVHHPFRKKEHTEQGFTRLSSGTEEDTQMYSFRFDVSLQSLNTTDEVLISALSKITHIVWRETIDVNSNSERADWIEKVNKYLPFVSAKPKSKKRNIEIRAEAKPTISEVKGIIEKYAKENRKTTDWVNVGFLVDNSITWVDKYRLRDQITIPSSSTKVLSAKFLLDQIKDNRANYLQPVAKALQSEPSNNVMEPQEKIYRVKDLEL